MPVYSYDTYQDLRKSNLSSASKPPRKVGYFKLNDGEKAIVRFDYDTPSEFTIATIHEVKVQDRFRSVVCLKDKRDATSTCPLCESGAPLKERFFVRLVRYSVDESTGKVTPVAEVANWPKGYADVLRARINEYGSLKDNLFTVTRMGTGKDTKYDITFANPVKYSEANGYVKDFSAFEGFELAHHSYMERSKEDIEEFLHTGNFPFHKKNEGKEGEAPKQETSNVSYASSAPTPSVTPTPTTSVPTEPARNTTTYSPESSTVRPRRTYDI